MNTENPPSLTVSYLRALTPRRPNLAESHASQASQASPSIELHSIATDPPKLRRYRDVCGFADDGTLPATFPHLTTFPLAMALMTRRSFPIPVLGLIHIANEIIQTRPLTADSRLDYQVWIEPPREHPKGVAFDVCSQAWDSAAGEPVWSSISTYLHRQRTPSLSSSDRPLTPAPPAPSLPPVPPSSATSPAPTLTQPWRLPASLGRRYASVSGDRNPIHLFPLAAKPFGFPRAIAHGMWTNARCLAALSAPSPGYRFPGSFRLRVEFSSPILLPSTVAFSSWHSESEHRFAVRSPDRDHDHDHLLGRLTAL